MKHFINIYREFRSQIVDIAFSWRKIFTDPSTGEKKKVGDTVTIPTLAETYKKIAKEGVNTFYNGSLRDDLIADLKELGNHGWLFILSAFYTIRSLTTCRVTLSCKS